MNWRGYGYLSLGVVVLCLAFSGASVAAPAEDATYQGFWAFSWGNSFLSEAETNEMMKVARDSNSNIILPEVRKAGDAYYKSETEIRPTNLSAGYEDPLADILAKAHDTSDGKQYIHVHAWMVPYRVWKSGPAPEGHVLSEHPDWLTKDVNGKDAEGVLDPGIPEVQDYLVDVFLEVAKNYPVDGIHYDYIRYFGNEWGYHPVAIKRFQKIYGRTDVPAKDDKDWCDFRREQVKILARKTYAKVKEVRWDLNLSASVVGFSPGPASLEVSDFHKTRPYNEVLQDFVGMMQEGSLDLLCQMNYKREFDEQQKNDFRLWTKFNAAHKYGRHAVVGVGNYLNSIEDSVIQMNFAHNCPGNDGTLVYRYGAADKDNKHSEFWKVMAEKVYDKRREVPEATWLKNPDFGIVYGTVTDSDGNIVDGADVELSGPSPATVRTDGSGFYTFLRVPEGSGHKATVKVGDTEKTVEFDITAGKVTVADISLSK